MRALDTMAELADRLRQHDIHPIVPAADDLSAPLTPAQLVEVKREASRLHFAHIRDPRTSALVVVNPDRHGTPSYVGPNTFAEIAVAFADERAIYLLHDIPTEYEDELRAWGARSFLGSQDGLVSAVAEMKPRDHRHR
ncbi:hypothetical protein SAMN04489844_1465 [Nocardioides exalbidus]|uniref:Uncharacterized protein n=2 Tax=Nocardioides exalbidus TaxID=402596 RepID=A0A1H4NVF9_9ACTN|nr:hypothetical protein SAMN04489844_1465 [Nocardioides exalbidus]